MNWTQQYLTKNRCFLANRKIEVKGLMLHSVGCSQPDPDVFAKLWNTDSAQVLVHGIIGVDKALQFLPWDARGWHCGTGTSGQSANNTHIGIEMTEPSSIRYTGSGAEFWDLDPDATAAHIKATYQAAVELFAGLCAQFNLDPLTSIISHSEGYKQGVASNHADPEHLWNKHPELGYTMDNFRQAVKERIRMDTYAEDTSAIMNAGPSAWSKDAVEWATATGIMQGYEDNSLRLRMSITREEAVTMLYRYHQKFYGGN